jgi:hypothetical protein
MLAVLLLCFAIVTAVGPQRVFYALHEWIFAGMAPWHFYFQDSLMTTMLTEPLFGSISIYWWEPHLFSGFCYQL